MMDESRMRSRVAEWMEEMNRLGNVYTLSPEETEEVNNRLYEAMKKSTREFRRKQGLSWREAGKIILTD